MVLIGVLMFINMAFGIRTESAQALPFKKHADDREEKDPSVIIETDKGNFKILIFKKEVPQTAENFLSLVEKGFYNGIKFHRYEQDFCIQGGDPGGTGHGGSDKTIPLEISKKLRHNEAGMVGMGRPENDRNGATSQFYITLKPQNGLDGDYAIFGKVTEGLDIVYQLRKGDTINKAYVEGSQEGKK